MEARTKRRVAVGGTVAGVFLALGIYSEATKPAHNPGNTPVAVGVANGKVEQDQKEYEDFQHPLFGRVIERSGRVAINGHWQPFWIYATGGDPGLNDGQIGISVGDSNVLGGDNHPGGKLPCTVTVSKNESVLIYPTRTDDTGHEAGGERTDAFVPGMDALTAAVRTLPSADEVEFRRNGFIVRDVYRNIGDPSAFTAAMINHLASDVQVILDAGKAACNK